MDRPRDHFVHLGCLRRRWPGWGSVVAYEDNVALIDVIKRVRARARKVDPESTFNAETNSISGLEWDGEVLDYTWNWISDQFKEGHLTTTTYLEYIEAAPILNVLRSPRVNYNIESSPLAVKKGFADGAYLNFLLRKPDGENGSAILGEKPALSPVVKQMAPGEDSFCPSSPRVCRWETASWRTPVHCSSGATRRATGHSLSC